MDKELNIRIAKIQKIMADSNIDAALVASNVNLLYTTGQIIAGYVYIPVDGESVTFVKRPNNLSGPAIHQIRKPEQIPPILEELGIRKPSTIMLEADELTYNEYTRLAACFKDSQICNCGTRLLQSARTVKTAKELELFRETGLAHTRAYSRIPSLFRYGMTDTELSIEVERAMRLEGMLGQLRIYGQSMELFMGSVLAADNAAAPSAYDFALGGGGSDPSLPVGANGTVLSKGHSVMVDIGGNLHGYLSDMSRTYSIGKLPDYAYTAHQACLDVQKAFQENARPGAVCQDLYQMGKEIIEKAGFADYFMGVGQKAGFIGHGIGLQLNEQPVFAPRMTLQLQQGMVFALEPKIVLPGIGPVGIENSWIVNSDSIEKITLCPDQIKDLTLL